MKITEQNDLEIEFSCSGVNKSNYSRVLAKENIKRIEDDWGWFLKNFIISISLTGLKWSISHLSNFDPNKYFEKYISNINLKRTFKVKKVRWKPLNIIRFFFENLSIIWSQAQFFNPQDRRRRPNLFEWYFDLVASLVLISHTSLRKANLFGIGYLEEI